MTDDLVKRLRDYTCDCGVSNPKHLTWEAADRIEQLEAALRKIAEGDRYSSDGAQFHIGYWGEFARAAVRMDESGIIARAALGEKKDD